MEAFTITIDIGYNDDSDIVEWVNVAENCNPLDDRKKKILLDAIDSWIWEEKHNKVLNMQNNMEKEIKYVGASFCCQCKTFRPKVEAFCKEKEIKFTYVDAEEESEFVAGLGIRNIPTVLLYEGEKLVKRGGIANWEEITELCK